MYDESKYWNEIRKWPNYNNTKDLSKLKDDRVIGYVRKNLGKSKCIMDFGPGIGRMFPLYKDMELVEAFDISDRWSKIVTNEARKFGFKFTFAVMKEIGKLPYKDKEFDSTVCMSVLFHQRPQYIDLIMSELARISGFVIASGSIGSKVDVVESESHFYRHNYEDICKRNNLEMFNIEYGPIKKYKNNDLQSIFFCFREIN